MDRQAQRLQIQAAIDAYFHKHIAIEPRAMAALQGHCTDLDGQEQYTPTTSIFEALLRSSPSCLSLLFDAGVPVDRLTRCESPSNAGPLLPHVLDLIFRGFFLDHRVDPDQQMLDLFENKYSLPLCRTAQEIQHQGQLSELQLFTCFLETAYTGPRVFSEHVDESVLECYFSAVGDILTNIGWIDRLKVVERIDRRTGAYRAESVAAGSLVDLAAKAATIDPIDPSHGHFQFALWLNADGCVHIRPFGVGGAGRLHPEYLVSGRSYMFRDGLFQPAAAILPGEPDGVVSELESLLNARQASEADFQRFFERHPTLLTGLEYRTAHPQLVLFDDDAPRYVPDFLLEPLSGDFCDIVELKLPYKTLVTRLKKESRKHFRSFVNEAIAQLVEYRRYFESKPNREAFAKRYGLKVYYPRLILVIGRAHHFQSDVQRQELKQLLPDDCAVWTYDDVLARARRYRQWAG